MDSRRSILFVRVQPTKYRTTTPCRSPVLLPIYRYLSDCDVDARVSEYGSSLVVATNHKGTVVVRKYARVGYGVVALVLGEVFGIEKNSGTAYGHGAMAVETSSRTAARSGCQY